MRSDLSGLYLFCFLKQLSEPFAAWLEQSQDTNCIMKMKFTALQYYFILYVTRDSIFSLFSQ